jgi:hypothetical protein
VTLCKNSAAVKCLSAMVLKIKHRSVSVNNRHAVRQGTSLFVCLLHISNANAFNEELSSYSADSCYAQNEPYNDPRQDTKNVVIAATSCW